MRNKPFANESDPLIRDHGALVLWRIKSRWGWALYYPNINREDMEQQGMIGLLRAKERFDPERGVKFHTYAIVWIDKYVQDYIRGNWCIGFSTPDYLNKSYQKRTSDEAIQRMEVASCTMHISGIRDRKQNPVHNILAEDSNVGSSLEARELLKLILKKMEQKLAGLYPRKRAKMLLNIFIRSKKGETLKQIGADYKLTKQRISQLNEIVNAVFQQLNEEHGWSQAA